MGTSNRELNQEASLKVSEHEASTNGDSKVDSPTAVNKVDVTNSSKKLNSSSSSSSFSSSADSTSPKLKENVSELSSPKHKLSNDETPVCTDSTLELRSDGEPMTMSPPTQVMERSTDAEYRIPSSVFARTKSNSPVDWSVASNESLFSIQMGNMSFIKDDFFWKSGELGLKSGELSMKSGELGMKFDELGMKSGELDMKPGELVTPEEPSTSVQMFRYSQTPKPETTASGRRAKLGAAVETMKEVLRECSDDQRDEKSVADGRIIRNSDGSTSTKSFAFSMDVDKSNSRVIDSAEKVDSEKPLLKVQSQTLPTSEQEPKSPAATLAVAKTGWFSCFPCC